MALERYKAKRNFARTREPAGEHLSRRKPKEPLFVVQKHAARRLHYDFRLEMEGVLKSWAVPKGFPTRRGDRRLAIQVEDHPFEYAQFEGTIPAGDYGAGTVMVWDLGTYQVSGDDPLGALQQGRLHLCLKGKKLKGEWTLVRMRRPEEEDKPQWLLLKSGADVPPLSARAENESALTRRTLEQIAEANDKQWRSGRSAAAPSAPAPAKPYRTKGRSAPLPRPAQSQAAVRPTATVPPPSFARGALNLPAGLPKAKPQFIAPMKALLVNQLPKGSQWIYEVKFDGVRALAIKTGKEVRLISRNAKDFSAKYSELLEPLRQLPAKEAVLDGEVVAVDPKGRSSFQLLQSYLSAGAEKPPLFYYVFDLLNLEGKDLTGLPLYQRKALAQALLADVSPRIRFSVSIQADSARVMREMQRRGLEGLIAKRKESNYDSGQRTGAWVKFKWTNEQEFVIGGYTRPQGTRSYFGALLVGYYQGDKLWFAGKVGTGFDEKLLASLHERFQQRVRPDCPFANLPEKPRPGLRSGSLTTAKMKFCTWLEPRLVCQVRFTEWTRDHHLRQPVFLGLREDKQPEEVVRENVR